MFNVLIDVTIKQVYEFFGGGHGFFPREKCFLVQFGLIRWVSCCVSSCRVSWGCYPSTQSPNPQDTMAVGFIHVPV